MSEEKSIVSAVMFGGWFLFVKCRHETALDDLVQNEPVGELQTFRCNALLFAACLFDAGKQRCTGWNVGDLSHFLTDIVVIGDSCFLGAVHLQIFLDCAYS